MPLPYMERVCGSTILWSSPYATNDPKDFDGLEQVT